MCQVTGGGGIHQVEWAAMASSLPGVEFKSSTRFRISLQFRPSRGSPALVWDKSDYVRIARVAHPAAKGKDHVVLPSTIAHTLGSALDPSCWGGWTGRPPDQKHIWDMIMMTVMMVTMTMAMAMTMTMTTTAM